MDKIKSKNTPETRVSEEVYMKNGNAVYRKVKEVIETREETTIMLPPEILKKKMIVCCHAKIVSPVCIEDHFRVYYSDIMKGEDILKIFNYENNKCRNNINVAIIHIDGSVEVVPTNIENYDRHIHIRPDREYRIGCYHCSDDGECFIGVHKTSHPLFQTFNTIY